MARKKGGLGQAAPVEQPEDLLDSVFGAAKESPKADTPPPAPVKDAGKGKENRVGKYFLIDRDLAKALKLYAVQNDMKEIAVMEASLRAFLGKADD